ncbi:hypothetical protein [Enterococcus pallens]|uniref:DUF3862 domain-containing protein n=1 Tax=Enterococcus pallens ATCC BAA-351 TaxID=1158607 RepID=R2SJG0_9ENTE|nr:hypothetical protein [Enterococcus pallens]EOH95355.1 hypothetical protein UAU_01317 [Enterococcus pallens ATCC BAA-351]EOU21508.1 hypothetical protein I588_02355 [Enterococcus pallens ATCC BAA-351]OJG79663.1 hypothetical protein RV10_GL000451 [Enterococcus pallens]
MKKIGFLVFGLAITLSFSGCGDKNENDLSESSSTQASTPAKSKKSKVKLTYMDYFAAIDVGESLEQVEEKMGDIGEITYDSEYSTTYFWDVEDGHGVTVDVDKEENKVEKVELEYDVKDITNQKTKVKDLDELKTKINDGVTYDEVKEWVGGVDGVLCEKTEDSKDYYWRGTDNSSLSATFSNETGLCLSYVGFGN